MTGVRREARGEVVLVRGRTEVASWPFWIDGRLDLQAVDDLARLQLAARAIGCSIRLRHACPKLVELLRLAGLSAVVPAVPLGKVEGEPEDGEEGGRVEEVVVTDDPPV